MIKNREGFRLCIVCKIEKPLTSDYYHADKNRPNGRMYRCKECEKIRTGNQDRHNRWLKMNPLAKEKVKINNKKYAQTEVGKSISSLSAYRKADQRKGFTTTITRHDVLEARNSCCFYCGFEPTGLDRIDNSLGHTKENCVPCCSDCNIARMDNFTHEEMIVIGKTIRYIKAERERKMNGICML